MLIPTVLVGASKGRLIGKVVDPEGKPIQGVNVTVTSPDVTNFNKVFTTDRKGMFVVDFDRIGVTYHYRFDKTGYQSMETQQQWSKEGSEMFDWTMPLATVEAPPAADTAPPASSSAPAIEAFNTGLAALKAKDYATAAPHFREAVKHDPNLRPGWEALSTVELELGRNEAAAAAAEKAIALGSTQEPVYLARWNAYRKLANEAKTAEALKDLERIGRAAEEAKRIHNEGVTLAKAGDDAGAFAKFQEALAIDPNLEEALLGLATAGSKIGRNAEAITAAETLLESRPDHEAAVRVRFNAALALGDKAKLIDALVDLAPYEPSVARDGLLKLAFEAYDANDNAVAEDRFRKVTQIDPKYPQAWYYLGVVTAAQGKTTDARKAIERFLQLAPNDPEAKSARDMLQYLK